MNGTDFYAIIERDHRIQNPISADKLMLVADYCRVGDGTRILDIGCGKGWLLRSLAEAWEIQGTGLEINPSFMAEARSAAQDEGVDDRITFIEGPALDFQPEPESYDVVLCVGASFAIGSFAETLAWMRRALRPGGTLAIGEPFLQVRPSADLLLEDQDDASYLDLSAVTAEIEQQGLELTGLIGASTEDFDHYYTLWWRAAYEWAAANPGHPDRAMLLSNVDRERRSYLRWERRHLEWGIFVARNAQER